MDITKMIAMALVGVLMTLTLKQYKPEFAIYVSILCGCFILFYVFQKLTLIIELIKGLIRKINLREDFFEILLKATGVAYLTEFACQTCKDVGETAIASKVECAGRILILSMSIPILTTLVELMLDMIPS